MKINGLSQKIRLADFQLDEDRNVYFYEKFQDFDYSDGIKTEKYILRSIKESDDIDYNSYELTKRVKDWPSYYHLGVGRGNILTALDLSRDAKVLELGCGCGAITRYLGENFKTIDAVEGSLFRTQITRERCRDLENVKVYCSNFNNLLFDPIYDIVTAIGVLEYAPLYFDDKSDPKESCLSFLKHLNSALTDSGLLILGIENKIGIKYWSGLPEDHTGIVYDGIQDYPSSRGPITFSKKEIKELLLESGFQNIFFFYCFPDYKFTDVMISDKGFEQDYYLHNWIGVPFESYTYLRQKNNFHEGLVVKTLSEAGLLGEFANSFLIIASKDESESFDSIDWIVKKFSVNRKDPFKCITTLKDNSGLCVEKERVNCGDEDYIFENNGIKIKHKLGSNDWVPGDSVMFNVYKAFFREDWKKEILDILEPYYAELNNFESGKTDDEGYPLLTGADMDLALSNLIKYHDNLYFIDDEWSVDDISSDYVFYRCILRDIVDNNIYLRKKVINIDKFVFETIKHFYPNYDAKRHNKNKKIEKNLQKLISIKKPIIVSNIISNAIIGYWVMRIWNLTPESIKKFVRTRFI